MEKIINFNQQEQMQSHQIDQKRVNILAQIGALMLDLETSKKALDSCNEERNAFVKQVILGNGVTQFDSARPTQNGVIVNVPDSSGNVKPNGAENATSQMARES